MRMCRQSLPICLCLCFIFVVAPIVRADEPLQRDAEAEKFFSERVKPILERHCYECHSHQAKKSKGGLVLDSRSGWQTGGESGPAIVPGKPAESLLLGAVQYEDLEMPPDGKLPDESIETLQLWITRGAYDPRVTKSARGAKGIDMESGRKHWAFQPIRPTTPPQVEDLRWPLDDVDCHVLAKIEQANLGPVSQADRYKWLRRVSFDLTGMPPTVAEIHDFESDKSPKAREKVVDRLLASRHFGERWARHWLDLVGYADQVGTSNSVFAEHAWRYRDYVIDTYNNDKPFDQFIREQIAGDLLPWDDVPQRASSITATGFLVLGDIEIVEADKEKLLVDIVDQQLNKVGKAFLGLTLECARCHDHKFDPVLQRDYYAIAGFFHSTSTVFKTDRGVWSDINVVDLPETEAQKTARGEREEEHADKLSQWKTEQQQARENKAKLDEQLKNAELPQEKRDKLTKQRDAESARIGQLTKQIQHAVFFAPTVPKVHGVRDVENPSDMNITIRGNPRALGDQVPRGFLQVFSPAPAKVPVSQSGRRELAEWVASNPLAARVAVNRIWQKLFGAGLVRTVDYFGLPGDRPSHPELLEHLAARFIDEGWSQKRLIRSLVLSRTYGLDSAHSETAHATDPENRLLWRMNRSRLDAEALRDAMIFVAGQLQPSNGGPALPLEYLENVGGLNPTDVNPPNFRLAKWRPTQEFERTIYLPVIRDGAQPGPATLRNVFDFAQPSQFSGQRDVTAVPTQALFLMNSPVVRKHAAALAARLRGEADESKRLELLWLALLNRQITAEEQVESAEFLKGAGDNAWTELCHALLASNEFLIRL